MPKINARARYDVSLEPEKVEEVLRELWRLPFNTAVKEAFVQIDKLFNHVKVKKKTWKPADVRAIVDQFIFNTTRMANQEEDGRSTMYRIFRPMWELNPIRVLEIAELIVRTVTAPTEEKDRQALFDTFFYRRTFEEEDFMVSLLCLSAQLAAGAQNTQYLKCCATWLKETGLDSFAATYIAKEIVKDFSQIDGSNKYFKLPEFAPEFAASLVMAIARAYRDKDRPEFLLQQMSVWIECYPSVCFMPPQSSIFELFRWYMHVISPEPRLHAAILSAIHRDGRGAHLQVIPHVMQIIQEFKSRRDSYCQKYELTSLTRRYLKRKRQTDIQNGVESARVSYDRDVRTRNSLRSQICRLFQLIQMLISAGCLEENEIQPIFQAYEASLEFKFNLYIQLKSKYGAHEDSVAGGAQLDPPPGKKMYGKYGHHLKHPVKAKRLQLTQPGFCYPSTPLEGENVAYMNPNGEPWKYSIESDSSENEWEDINNKKKIHVNNVSSSQAHHIVEKQNFTVDEILGRNGCLK